MRDQKPQYTKTKSHSAMVAETHPYMKPARWIKDLVFWNTAYHNQAKYEDFHQRMIAEAGRRGKS